MVVPKGTDSPGPIDLDNNIAVPETSVAVGSTQNATAEVTPNSTWIVCSTGHKLMIGLTVSTAKSYTIRICIL